MVSTLPLYISLGTTIALLFLRKTFSYYKVGGVYIIEFLMALSIVLYCIIIFVNLGKLKINRRYARNVGLSLTVVFFLFSIIRALFSFSIDLQNLIPGIYPLYIMLIALFAMYAPKEHLWKMIQTIAVLLILSPFIPTLVGVVLVPIFGPIESPGWTFIFAVSAILSLIWLRNMPAKLFFFTLSILSSLLAFERATFVNAFVAIVFLLYAFRKQADDRKSLLRSLGLALVVFIASLLVFPLIFKVFFSGAVSRFDVTFENLIGFFVSIFSSDISLSGAMSGASVAGTRSHRLSLWAEALTRIAQTPFSVLFGVGYTDTVAQSVSFRQVHNGFITVLYRNGIVGLLIFLQFMYRFAKKYVMVIGNAISARELKAALLGLICVAALLGDCLTGTIIDSPFTSFIAYAIIGITLAYLKDDETESTVNP